MPQSINATKAKPIATQDTTILPLILSESHQTIGCHKSELIVFFIFENKNAVIAVTHIGTVRMQNTGSFGKTIDHGGVRCRRHDTEEKQHF